MGLYQLTEQVQAVIQIFKSGNLYFSIGVGDQPANGIWELDHFVVPLHL